MTQSMYAPSTGLRRSAERETYLSPESSGARARSTSTQALDRAGAGKSNTFFFTMNFSSCFSFDLN